MANPENIKPYQFKFGQKAPPNAGRPKGPSMTTTLQKLIEKPLKMKDFTTGELETLTLREWMNLAVIRTAMKGNVSAYKEIIDRVDGKVDTTINHKGINDVNKIDLNVLTDDQLDAIEGILGVNNND